MFAEMLAEIVRAIIEAAIYGLAIMVGLMWAVEFFLVTTSKY